MRVVGVRATTIATSRTTPITVLTHHIIVEGLLSGNLLLNATAKERTKQLFGTSQKYPVELCVLVVESSQLVEAKGYLRVVVAYGRIRGRKSIARCGQTRNSSTRIDRKHYV